MRIVFVTDSYFPTRDGVVTSIETTRRELESRGHTVFVVAPDPGEADRLPGIIYFPSIKFKNYADYFIPVYPSNKVQTIKDLEPDVIHLHGVALMVLKGYFAARALKVPMVLTFHTMVMDLLKIYVPQIPETISRPIVSRYLRWLMARPDALISPSISTEKELMSEGIHAKRSEIIPTGVESGRYNISVDIKGIRGKLGLEDRKVIVHVGRLSPEKNIDVAISSLKHLPDEYVLVVVGKGPASDSLRELTAELGLEDRVTFTGFVSDDDLPSYYRMADVVVSASRFETQGLTIVEAMSTGTPVVCSRGCAFDDFVEDGFNGTMFDGGPEECAESILRCFENHERYVAGALETAEEFSVGKSVDKLEALYRAVIRGGHDDQ